jgi:presenilin-like A22 family membrane protease
MFLITQFIGLYVVNHYSDGKLPYGLETPSPEQDTEFFSILTQIILAFIIAIFLVFFLAELKIEFLLKLWFFLVVVIALAIFFNSVLPKFQYVSILSLIIALPLAFFKIYRQNLIVHNLTELAIYPGIATIFIPILNLKTMIIFLIIISVYDMWAVWKSGIMQKMAKFQIINLKIFPGFFIPYVSKKVRMKLKKMKKSDLKKKKIRANVAILGGGDIVFPIITAGVMLKTFNSIYPALLVILGAALGLSYLFFFAKKKKFYPAMPFISAGMFLAMAVSYFLF